MLDALRLLFDTNGFPARWHCGLWTPVHGWTHVVADILVWGAYMAIPITLVLFLRRREAIPFPRILWLFVAFILACGFTHLIDATLFWHPWYRLSALAKVATAAVSWVTVVALVRVMPEALRYPGLAEQNARLETEVEQRRRTEVELEQSRAELEELTSRLARANAGLHRFAASASHDLRAPLRGVAALVDMIAESGDGTLSDENRAALRMVRDRVGGLEELVRDMLSAARAAGSDQLDMSLDLADVVRALRRVTDIPDTFELRAVGRLPALRGPSNELTRVMANLVQNAVAHHDRGAGVITVEASHEGSMVRVIVADDGPGVPQEDRDRIFDGYRRRGHEPGRGLGLPMVRRLVRAAGGDIGVADRPDGRGACFWFTWPAAD